MKAGKKRRKMDVWTEGIKKRKKRMKEGRADGMRCGIASEVTFPCTICFSKKVCLAFVICPRISLQGNFMKVSHNVLYYFKTRKVHLLLFCTMINKYVRTGLARQ